MTNNVRLELKVRVESEVQTDQGRRRPNNEDFAVRFEPNDPEELEYSGCLYIVADGVGGANKGEKASQYAARKVSYEYYRLPEIPPGERLRNILRNVGNEIYNYTDEKGLGRMATTLVAAVIRGDRLTIANVGDSRAYLIRGGQVHQITRDHNQLAEIMRSGGFSEDEPPNPKAKNTLTRSLGGHQDVTVDVFEDIPLLPDDLLLMCTDGLSRYAQETHLEALIKGAGTAQEICARLIGFANESGGADNITVISVVIHAPDWVSKQMLPAQNLGYEDPPTESARRTDPSLRAKKSGGRKRSPDDNVVIPRRYLYMAVAAMSSLIILVTGALVMWDKIFPLEAAGTQVAGVDLRTTVTPTATTLPPSATPSLTAPVATATQTITPTTGAATIAATGAEITPSPANFATALAETTATTRTTTATQLPPDISGKGCVYQVKKDDRLSGILESFGLPYTAGQGEYFYFLPTSCDLEKGICEGSPAKIDDVEKIDIGWIIEIPDVSQPACRRDGGDWISIIKTVSDKEP